MGPKSFSVDRKINIKAKKKNALGPLAHWPIHVELKTFSSHELGDNLVRTSSKKKKMGGHKQVAFFFLIFDSSAFANLSVGLCNRVTSGVSDVYVHMLYLCLRRTFISVRI